MNVKLFFFPLAIIIALAMGMFFIQPEFVKIQQNRNDSAKKEAEFATIDQKVQNAQLLATDLDNHKSGEDLVMRYLPEARYDDRIVDAINFLVSQTGLSLVSIKINPITDIVRDTASETASVSNGLLVAGNSDTGIALPVSLVSKPKNIAVTTSVIGSYENIRNLAGLLTHMDRFQNFMSLDISKLPVERKTEAEMNNANSVATPSILTATLTMNFAYIPKIKVQGTTDIPVLNQVQFDFSSVDKLRQFTSAGTIPSMEVGSAGASNPFLR
jgi:Tfp pilus assembly protein PilO